MHRASEWRQQGAQSASAHQRVHHHKEKRARQVVVLVTQIDLKSALTARDDSAHTSSHQALRPRLQRAGPPLAPQPAERLAQGELWLPRQSLGLLPSWRSSSWGLLPATSHPRRRASAPRRASARQLLRGARRGRERASAEPARFGSGSRSACHCLAWQSPALGSAPALLGAEPPRLLRGLAPPSAPSESPALSRARRAPGALLEARQLPSRGARRALLLLWPRKGPAGSQLCPPASPPRRGARPGRLAGAPGPCPLSRPAFGWLGSARVRAWGWGREARGKRDQVERELAWKLGGAMSRLIGATRAQNLFVDRCDIVLWSQMQTRRRSKIPTP